MRQLLAVFVVLAACVIGFGFYRGWFAMSNTSINSPAGNGDVNINLSTDKGKFNQDVQTVKDKASELTGNSTEEGPAEPDNRVKGSLKSENQ